MNGIGDAIIIETYINALSESEDVFAFVTHNILAVTMNFGPLVLMNFGPP
jgi:hypothetical protein